MKTKIKFNQILMFIILIAITIILSGLLSFFGMGVDVDVILKGAFSFGVGDGSIAIDDMKILSTEQLTKTTANILILPYAVQQA